MSSKASARPEKIDCTPAVDSTFAINFFENRDSLFSEKSREASNRDRLRSGAFLDYIERSYRVSAGLAVIFRMLSNNETQRCLIGNDPASGQEPPLANHTVASLSALGAVVLEMMMSNIEDICAWADKHGVIDDGEQAHG